MKTFPLVLGAALLLPFAALAPVIPAADVAHAQEAAAPQSGELAERLALPFASGLVGAADAPVFAWVENRAGVRNVMIGAPGRAAQRRTDFTQDDGVEISGIALSPDGSRLVFVRGGDAEFPEGRLPNTGVAADTPTQSLGLLDVTGNAPAREIGQGHSAVFSPDGKRLVFTKAGAIMLWSDDTPARRIAKVMGTVEDMSWSPDGSRLLFRENRRGHSLIGLIEVATGALRYFGATLGHASDPAFSPDGSQVAYIQFRSPPAELTDSKASFWTLRIADPGTGTERVVWTAPEGEGGQYYGTRGRNLFWASGGNLLFPWERTGWLHIYAVPASGKVAARDLTPDANEVENFRPTPDGRALVYSANPGNLDSRQIWQVGLGGGATKRLTPTDQFAFFPVFGGDRLAATITSATSPAHMVLVDGMKPLGAPAQARGYVTPETVVFTAADGVKVHGQLFRGQGKGPRPALVFVHGGPRRQMLPGYSPLYYYNNAYVRNQEFAAQGYTVLSVNYRSGTNYGRAFREAAEKGRDGASEYRDVLAGGKWLAARSDVDPARIGIWGGSWGGYLAALALARNSDLFAAGVDMHGVHAMVRTPDQTYSPKEAQRVQQVQWDSSPMGSIGQWRSPVLLVHGDDDSNVDYSQSLLLARELAAREVPFEELSLPNERHDFFRYGDWLRAYRATGDFFDRKLEQRP
jgi:Dipeptidyl aminopeptidases/acylaminoacyl-peptidases